MTTSAPAAAPVTIRDRVKELRRVQARALNAPPVHPESEAWRPVVGHEGVYEVSNEGRVRRIAAQVGRRGRPPGYVLREHLNRQNGYVYVSLNNRGHFESAVHVLVASAFLARPEGCEVDHGDGCRGNNALWNLEWVTKPVNQQRALARQQGERREHWNAKLSIHQVLEIRALLKAGAAYRDLAARFGVSVGAIQCARRKWRWLSEAGDEARGATA